MHKTSQKVVETTPRELQLFQDPTLASAIEDAVEVDVLPLNQTTDTPVLEFVIASSEYYVYPPNIRLYLKSYIENLSPQTVKIKEVVPPEGPVGDLKPQD